MQLTLVARPTLRNPDRQIMGTFQGRRLEMRCPARDQGVRRRRRRRRDGRRTQDPRPGVLERALRLPQASRRW